MRIVKLACIVFLQIFVFCEVFAQQNVIAPLFGIEGNAIGGVDFQSINQVNGNTTFIQNLGIPNFLNQPHTANYNFKTLYYGSNFGPTQGVIQSFDVPFLFSSNMNFSNNTGVVQGELLGLEYFHPNNTLLAFTEQFIYSYSQDSLSQFGQNTFFINFPIDSNSISTASSNQFVFMAINSTITEIECGLIVFEGNQLQLIVADTIQGYDDLYLFSHPEIDSSIFCISRTFDDEFALHSIDNNNYDLSIIVDLPSCVGCVDTTYNYYKHSITIDAENEHVILVRSEDNSGVMTYFLSTFSLIDGQLIRETPITNFMSNLYYDKASADLVFPGDANHDKVVDMEDLLPIGLHYNEQVIERLDPTTAWIGQFAFSNGDTLANGVDIKHIDSNGDGQINSLDNQAILDNFNSIHNSEKKGAGACQYQVNIELADTLYENRDAEINFRLGQPASITPDVYGLTFTLSYPSDFVVENTMDAENLISWFGEPDSNSISLHYDEHDKGLLHVGITGIDKLNRSGDGVILKGRWTMEDELIPIANQYDSIVLVISNVTVIDKDENVLDGCGSTKQIAVYDKTVAITELAEKDIQIYPIPSSTFVSMAIDNDIEVQYMELHNTSGQLVKSFSQAETVQVEGLDHGVYLLTFHTNRGKAVRKVVVE